MMRNAATTGANTSSQPMRDTNNFRINRMPVNTMPRYTRMVVRSAFVFFFLLLATDFC